MDAGKQPLPAACSTNDVNAAVSAACGVAMQPVCSLGYGNNNNEGVIQSMLFNSASNCSNWMQTLQNVSAVTGTPQAGSPYLDAAMQTYCSGPGSLTDECGCIAFPIAAAAWCASSSITCPGSDASACEALEFAQTVPSLDALDVIQFTTCNPYYCWLADCYQTPQTQLLPSDILTYQASSQCAGVCGQFIGSSSENIAPMPPNTFSPASITANESGIGSCGAQNKPALLVAEVTDWVWPSNAIMMAPLFMSNDGDYLAQVQLTSASLDICSVQPANALLLPRTSQQFTVVCDQASVSAWYTASASYDPQTAPQGPPSLTINPMFEWQYMDIANGGNMTMTEPMGIFATIMPASGPIVETVSGVPAWFWLAVSGVALVALVQLVLIAVSKRGVRKLLAQGGVSL